MNTSAEQAWYATETSTGGVKMMSVEDGYKVLFRKKKEGSNTALDEPKYVFDPLCRWIDAVRKFRAKFRRGIMPPGLHPHGRWMCKMSRPSEST